jgi:two-component system response regulator YesN
MKILIVDDEKNIRAGLIKILSEAIPQEHTFIEAKNGEEAWRHMQQEQPELLITDIRMPKMDGMELMRQASGIPNRPEMIVLSGYDEFTYARESIKYGVRAYILKPVDNQELIREVLQAIKDIQTRLHQQEEKMLLAAMTKAPLEKDPLHRLIASGTYRIAKLIQGTEPLNPELFRNIPYYIIEEKRYSLCLVVSDQHVSILAERVAQAGSLAAFSEPIRSEADLLSSKTHAELGTCARFFSEIPSPLLYDAFSEPVPYCPDIQPLDSVLILIGSGDKAGIERMLQSLFTFQAETLFQKSYRLYQIINQIPLLFVTYHQQIEDDSYLIMKSLLLQDMDRYRKLHELQKDITDFFLYLDITLHQRYSAYPFIEKAISYINRHFTENITMATVANECSVNYTYFSEKFKIVVGQNFNDYIKQLRIEAAKRLLQQGCYKVYEVASRSGFGDVKYFMKTFKEATGLSPGEYQKRFIS